MNHCIKSFFRSRSYLTSPIIDLEFSLRQLIHRLGGLIPSDSGRLDRIIHSFSSVLRKNNHSTFLANKDICYILTFSMILLNTDLHHSINEGRRMTQEEFQLNTWKSIEEIKKTFSASEIINPFPTLEKMMLELQILYENINNCELGSEIILPPMAKNNILQLNEEIHHQQTTSTTSTSTTSTSKTSSLIEGYLYKKGNGYWGDWKWRKRYFILKRKNSSSSPQPLLLYSNAKEYPPRAAISLMGIVVKSLNRDGKFFFTLIPDKFFDNALASSQSEEMETLNAFSLLSGYTLSSLTLNSTSSTLTMMSSKQKTPSTKNKILFAKGIEEVNWMRPSSLRRDSFTFEAENEEKRDLWVESIRSVLYNSYRIE